MKRFLMFFVAHFAECLGYKVVPEGSRLLQRPALDWIMDVLGQAGVSAPVICDVGANTGQSIENFLKVMPRARIHAFEPGPAAFAALSANWGEDERVSMSNIALGGEPGEAVLNENRELTMSSFYNLGQKGWGEVSATHLVKISTVDQYCADHQIEQLDLLKSDTQGHDLEVLKGAERMLTKRTVRLLCLELIFSEIYSGMPAYHEVLKWLSDRSYHLLAVTDIHYRAGGIGWADALFVPKPPTS